MKILSTPGFKQFILILFTPVTALTGYSTLFLSNYVSGSELGCKSLIDFNTVYFRKTWI
jgi:hypothetical protein